MEFCFYFILIGIRRILLYLYSSRNNHTHIHTKKRQGKHVLFYYYHHLNDDSNNNNNNDRKKSLLINFKTISA